MELNKFQKGANEAIRVGEGWARSSANYRNLGLVIMSAATVIVLGLHEVADAIRQLKPQPTEQG